MHTAVAETANDLGERVSANEPGWVLEVNMRVLCFAALLLGLALPQAVLAQPAFDCDDAPALPMVDGNVVGDSYANVSSGEGAGFGDIIGDTSTVGLDSDADGNLVLGLRSGDGMTCTAFDTAVVVYFDSVPGTGVAGTSMLNDTGDLGRAAISGMSMAGDTADLDFPSGFSADFALVIEASGANLFALQNASPHTHVGTLSHAPTMGFGTACQREIGGFSLSDLGTQAGNPVKWFATLINPMNAFRSNEFAGVTSAEATNIGASAHTMDPGDFNELRSVPGEAAFRGGFFHEDFATFDASGFAPAPVCGQLDSDSWVVAGMSDPDFDFGDVATSGDHARGTSGGGESGGGVYAFGHAPGLVAFGAQPTGSDFTPGSFTLRVLNDSGSEIEAVSIGTELAILNNATRATEIAVSYSLDDNTYTDLAMLSFTTPAAADSAGWTTRYHDESAVGLSIADGEYFYVRWTATEAGGSGSRDEFGIDSVTLRPTYALCGNGTLDPGEACDAGAMNGASTCGCQNDCTFAAMGTACSAGDLGACDAVDTCDGAGACTENFATGECRAAAGPCDVAEMCDGSSVACPADGVAAMGTVCLAASGDCDVADVCDGTTTACAPLVAAAGTECRAAAGTCDVAEVCDGTATACPADVVLAAATECRGSVGDCDVAEVCDGTSGLCPADVVVAAGMECRASADLCDAAEVCDGSGGACPADTFAAAGTECRASAGDCDVAEVCDGSGAACPADVIAPAMTECRASAGDCDVAEMCDGSSTACPADVVAPAATECRASAGDCDVAEMCDGTNAACPADVMAPAMTECRPSAGDCDVAETCDGASSACPADAVAPAMTECRASAGDCDVAEMCDGTNTACPVDALAASGTECRASAGDCDVAESCDGMAADCPADAMAADGTACANGTACDGAEMCMGGSCEMGTAIDCDDGDICTADMCTEPAGTCDNAPIMGCCTMDADCDDSDPATMDVCASNRCENNPIMDAGVPDAGVDGGMVAMDAGMDVDAGMMPVDAGIDADGGVQSDGGVESDAAVSSDASTGMDAGSEVDAGGESGGSGGGCSTGGTSGPLSLPLLLLALGLVRRRRR